MTSALPAEEGVGTLSVARLVSAVVASLAVLVALNAFLFPLVFPSGVASKFADMRSESLVLLHLAALVATAVLLTGLVALLRPRGSAWGAAGVGALSGLLASLPSTLHTQAMAHVAVSGEVAAVLWTSISWSVAAAAAHGALHWRSARRA